MRPATRPWRRAFDQSGTTSWAPLDGVERLGHVAGGEETGDARLHVLVDDEPGLRRHLAGLEETQVGPGAGADEEQVGLLDAGAEGTVCILRSGANGHAESPFRSRHGRERRSQPQDIAARAEVSLDHARALGVRDEREDGRLALDDAHLHARPAKDGGHFQARERSPNHQRPSGPRIRCRSCHGGGHSRPEPDGVVERAQAEDAGEVESRNRRVHRRRTGGHEASAVGVTPALGGGKLPAGGIEAGNAHGEVGADPVAGVELPPAERKAPLSRNRARREVGTQGGVVRRVSVIGKHVDRPLVAGDARGQNRFGGGRAVADDDEVQGQRAHQAGDAEQRPRYPSRVHGVLAVAVRAPLVGQVLRGVGRRR